MDPYELPTGSATVDELLGDRYELDALLGSGGAADVHAATDLLSGRKVAIKVFRADGDDASRARFAAEADLLAGLTHPSLVQVIDICLGNDPPYLVMPRITGGTLRQLMDHGPLLPSLVAGLGAQVADALAHVHEREVVHRDIKPSNVLLDETGWCYLADFGVARLMSAAHVTGTGEFVGTARYLAPEQVTGGESGPPVDIYALGLVLLECLTGHPEYTGTPIEVALVRLTRQPRVPLELSASWRDLLGAMTARDAGERPTASQCAGRLAVIAEEDAAPLPEPVHDPPPVPETTATMASLATTGTATAASAALLDTTWPAAPTAD